MKTPSELIQRSLDLTLSTEDQNRLSEILATSEEARNLYDQLKRVDTSLATAERVEAPAGLVSEVMRKIRSEPLGAPARPSVPSWMERFALLLRQKPAYGVSLGFALGVLTLLPVAWQLPSGDFDASKVSGSMLGAPESYTGAIDIQTPWAQGTCRAFTHDGQLTVELELESEFPVAVEIQHQGTELGLAGAVMSIPAITYLESLEHQVRFSHSGTNVYHLTFVVLPRQKPAVSLTLTAEGNLVYQRSLELTSVNRRAEP